MSIPAAATNDPFVSPNLRATFVNEDGTLTTHGQTVISQLTKFLDGTNRVIPCNASGTNAITLTMLSVSPLVRGYVDYDTFRFVAVNTSNNTVTANVVTPQGSLATLNVYKSNGSAPAGGFDVTAGLLYDLVYVDSLNSGAGGFVLR